MQGVAPGGIQGAVEPWCAVLAFLALLQMVEWLGACFASVSMVLASLLVWPHLVEQLYAEQVSGSFHLQHCS